MKRVGPKDFLAITDWDSDRVVRILELARRVKRGATERRPGPFANKHMALVFQKPSLRTRLSFEVGFSQLGGRCTYTGPSDVGLGKREPAADVARVLSRYVDLIVARVFEHSLVEELAAASRVPVINGLSDFNHPCQILADLLTALENFGSLDGLHVAWIGDGNNVAVSWLNAARRLPIRLTLACPAAYQPPAEVMAAAAEECGARVTLLDDPKAAVAGAQVVTTDTWYSMGQEEQMAVRRRDFAGYTVDAALMAAAADDAIFLHCLPAHRGDEVTAEVIEGAASRVFDQAENRMHAQKAVMLSVLTAESAFPA